METGTNDLYSYSSSFSFTFASTAAGADDGGASAAAGVIGVADVAANPSAKSVWLVSVVRAVVGY